MGDVNQKRYTKIRRSHEKNIHCFGPLFWVHSGLFPPQLINQFWATLNPKRRLTIVLGTHSGLLAPQIIPNIQQLLGPPPSWQHLGRPFGCDSGLSSSRTKSAWITCHTANRTRNVDLNAVLTVQLKICAWQLITWCAGLSWSIKCFDERDCRTLVWCCRCGSRVGLRGVVSSSQSGPWTLWHNFEYLSGCSLLDERAGQGHRILAPGGRPKIKILGLSLKFSPPQPHFAFCAENRLVLVFQNAIGRQGLGELG